MRRIVNSYFIVGLIVGLVALPLIARAGDSVGVCRETRRLTAEDYWFLEAYSGVTDLKDAAQERLGRLASDPAICFTVPLTDLNQPAERTRGYKKAIQEWFKWLSGDPKDPEVDRQQKRGREQFKSITGNEFPTRQDWTKWWVENHLYLVWSDKEQRLVVDLNAKRNKRPITETLDELSALDYWFYDGMGWLTVDEEQGDMLRVRTWNTEHTSWAIVRKTALNDRKAKEQGYREAVRNLILDRVALPEIKDEALEQLMARLRDLTGEKFTEREAWLEWWRKNQNRLVLSKGAKRLVVGPGS